MIPIFVVPIANELMTMSQFQIPLSLLNELNEAADWSEFLKFVDNVTVIQDVTKGDQLKIYGAWEDVDGIQLL